MYTLAHNKNVPIVNPFPSYKSLYKQRSSNESTIQQFLTFETTSQKSFKLQLNTMRGIKLFLKNMKPKTTHTILKISNNTNMPY